MRARLAIFALALLGVTSAQPAAAANWLEKNFGLWGPQYDAEVPLCEDDRVLSRIQSHFAQKEQDYWNSQLKITGWEYIRERAWMPWHYASIPRRFCGAKVHLSDGTVRRIGYVVGEDTGIIGSTWGVEFCVVGLDRNWAFMPACKEAGPSMAPQGGTATYSLPAE